MYVYKVFFLLTVCCFVGGCSSFIDQQPSMKTYTSKPNELMTLDANAPSVNISNLHPDEKDVLLDGHTYQFSIDVTLKTEEGLDAEYVVEPIFSRSQYGAFSLRPINQGVADINVFATLTWSTPVYGNDERIQINLYRLLRSKMGKTTFKTLVKSIERQYDVRCDPDGFFIVRFLRRTFGACHD